MRKLITLLALTIVIGAGCNSIRTTPLDRTESGALACGNHSGHLKGLPVMLRVPTHIEVCIYQRDFWYQNGKDQLVPVSSDVPTRFVTSVVKETEKMFLVDPKRPAAGTGSFSFIFSEDVEDAGKGYLSKANYAIEDETLTRSATLLTSIASLLAKRPPASKSSTGREQAEGSRIEVISTDRLLQMRRFNISSPNVDAEIEQFLDAQLNNCHTCF